MPAQYVLAYDMRSLVLSCKHNRKLGGAWEKRLLIKDLGDLSQKIWSRAKKWSRRTKIGSQKPLPKKVHMHVLHSKGNSRHLIRMFESENFTGQKLPAIDICWLVCYLVMLAIVANDLCSYILSTYVSMYTVCTYLRLNLLSSQNGEAGAFVATQTGPGDHFQLPKVVPWTGFGCQICPNRTTFGKRGTIFGTKKWLGGGGVQFWQTGEERAW